MPFTIVLGKRLIIAWDERLVIRLTLHQSGKHIIDVIKEVQIIELTVFIDSTT